MTTAALPISKNTRPAVDAFDIKAVLLDDIATAAVVTFAGKYDGEFDTEIVIDGRPTWVKVLFSSENTSIDVFRLNTNADPVEPEMHHWLSEKDRWRLVTEAEDDFLEREAEKKAKESEIARLEYEDRKYTASRERR